MKWLKKFESFKMNNIEGGLISEDDIIKCIKSSGVIWASIVKGLPGNDPEISLVPVSIDRDGLITVDVDGNYYSVDIKNVKKIKF